MAKKRFHKVHVEISNICNLKCSFCPPVERSQAMMALDLFETIIAQVAPLTELVCLHLMGEPLVHADFAKMVAICERYQVKIFLVSNGILLKPDRYATLLHPSFYQINFSLHSFFDNFTGKDPSRYLERIFTFTELAQAQRPELFINYRLWNLDDPLGSQTSNNEMLKRVCERFAVEPPSQIDVRQQKNYRLKNRLYLHFDTEFTWPAMNLPVLGKQGSCYGLSSHFGILVDGTLVPCCLDKEAAIALGNVNDTPIATILHSERARAMLAGFKQRQLVEPLCQRCQYIERFQDSRLKVKNIA